MINLIGVKRIYFIGVGGIGMSAVAGIAKEKGFLVAGSDDRDIYDPSKAVLDRFGINYTIGYAAANVHSAFGGRRPDLVVCTSAVDHTNPEILEAQKLGLNIISYPRLLGELSSDKKRIVVVGTHGKGTTTALISWVLKNIEDSSFMIGGVSNNLETNFYYGAGQNFVIEGDEYKAGFDDPLPKFMYYSPDILLLNNLEYDHPDMFPDFETMKQAFAKLVNGMSASSTIVYNADDVNVREIIKEYKGKLIGFGFEEGDVRAGKPVRKGDNFEIEITDKGESFKVLTSLPGMHYAYDILAGVTVLKELQMPQEKIIEHTATFTGIKRRYEIVSKGDYIIIDDYAHHPTAVRETLDATRLKYPDHRLVCFFEPHTYSRTKETLNDLAHSFDSADIVYLAEVYPAREQKLPTSITGTEVAELISKNHKAVRYVANKADALEKYKAEAKKGDVVVVMAVGSFNTLVYDLKSTL